MSDEDDFEPCHGLPELLPAGETMLWQGSPDWKVVARDALHLRALTLYFGLMLGWRGTTALADGAGPAAAATSVGVLAMLSLLALATLLLIAWLIGRTTVYTVTSERVVMRVGMVLSITFNLPYRTIEAAGLRLNADASGDIALQLAAGEHIAFLHLWPHVRPWRLKHTQPMLRALPQAARVAFLLSRALAESTGLALPAPIRPLAAPAAAPGRQANADAGRQRLAA